MVIDKLSNKAKVALLGKLDNSLDIYNSLEILARIATELDRGGFCEAASEVDELIKQKVKKLKEPGRLQAKALRKKFLSKK